MRQVPFVARARARLSKPLLSMKIVHIVIGVLCLGLTGSAAVWGMWCWYRARASRVFWWLLRAGQGFIVLEMQVGQNANLHGTYLLTTLTMCVTHPVHARPAGPSTDSSGSRDRAQS